MLPMYTCEWGRLEQIQIVGDPDIEITCIASDLGYRPSSWLPTKISFATGGAVLAVGILLAARKHVLATLALIVLFAAVTAAWFLPNGLRQPTRAGEPVCCAREIDRHRVRMWVIGAGIVVGLGLAATDLAWSHRRHTPVTS